MGMVRGTFITKAVGPVSILFMLLERVSETALVPHLFAFYSYWTVYIIISGSKMAEILSQVDLSLITPTMIFW